NTDVHARERQQAGRARGKDPESRLILRDPYAVLTAIAAESAVRADPESAYAMPVEAAGPGEPTAASIYLRDPFERLFASPGQSREEVLTKAETQEERKDLGRLAGPGTVKRLEGDGAAGNVSSLTDAVGLGLRGQRGQVTGQQTGSTEMDPER